VTNVQTCETRNKVPWHCVRPRDEDTFECVLGVGYLERTLSIVALVYPHIEQIIHTVALRQHEQTKCSAVGSGFSHKFPRGQQYASLVNRKWSIGITAPFCALSWSTQASFLRGLCSLGKQHSFPSSNWCLAGTRHAQKVWSIKQVQTYKTRALF
jgi:hypothetical protein